MQIERQQINELFAELSMPYSVKWTNTRLMDKLQKLPMLVDEDTDAGEYQDLLEEILYAVDNDQEIEIVEEREDDEQEPEEPEVEEQEDAEDGDDEQEDQEDDDWEDAEEEEPEEEKKPTKKATKKAPAKKATKKATTKKAPTKKTTKKATTTPSGKKVAKTPTAKKKGVVKKKPAGAGTVPKKTTKGTKTAKPKGAKGGIQKVGIVATIIECLEKATEKKPINKEQILVRLVEKFPERNSDSMKRTVGIAVPYKLRKEKGYTIESNEKGYWIPKSN